jgi:hypothetical protein
MSQCTQCGSQLPPGAGNCPSCGRPRKKTSAAVIVLVGCAIMFVLLSVFLFVGVGLTGITAAIFIPRHLDTLHKAKQQRAIAELLRMGTAIEHYKTEHGYAPAATDVNGLAEALGTVDGAAISRLDPWQHPYRYACWQENAGARGCDHYRIASAGADGRFEQSDLRDYTFARFPRLTYDHDIVFGDGAFVTSPK